MSSLPITFASTEELIKFAEEYLVMNRLGSLKNDIELCLSIESRLNPYPAEVETFLKTNNVMREQFAPFPALMYCFSIIDLLGALSAGHARSGSTTDNARNYMAKFMQTKGKAYQDWQINLLQKIYRHKIVHLSEPKALILYEGKIIGWRHDEKDEDNDQHLQIVCPDPPRKKRFEAYGKINIEGDCEFVVSVLQFKEEIIDSVTRATSGYLEKLRSDPKLRNKFVTGVNQIFDPNITD